MLTDVWNEVPVGTPKMEQLSNGWVMRYKFTESPNEGMVRCLEHMFSTHRKPKKEKVQEIVECAGEVFVPSEYGYED